MGANGKLLCTMRVISGIHKGFRFPEKNMPHARPTTDRSKEALFNILDQSYYFEDLQVLDLYSGLGSISVEFCSRGTTQITAVESHRKSIDYIQSLISKLNLPLILKQDKVLKYLAKDTQQYDIIFADPPYNENAEIHTLVDTIATGNFLKKGGIFILEHQAMVMLDQTFITETREYGQSTFSFFNFDEEE
jgi:16S rRNA (guanine966-N2)-methyltransferase